MPYAKIVFPLALIMFLLGADEYILSSILAPVGESFGVEPARVTLLVTVYALPCAVLAPFFGALSDRWGRRRVLLPSLAAFALATYGTGFAPTFGVALVCRFVTGAAAASLSPNAFALVGDLIPIERRNAAMGHTMLGVTIGLITAPAIGGWLTNQFGWRTAFALLATCAVFALAAVAVNIPEAPHSVHSASKLGQSTSAWRALTLPGVPAGIISQGSWIGVSIGVLAIVGEIFRTAYHLDIVATGITLASFGVLTVIGNLVVDLAVSWTGSTRGAILVAIAATCLGVAGLTLVRGWPIGMALASFWLWAVFAGFGGPALQAYLSDLGGERRGVVLSTSASAMHLGVVMMTFVEAWVFPRFGPPGVGWVACGAMLAAFFAQLRWR